MPEDEESLERARNEAASLLKYEPENLVFEIFNTLLILASENINHRPETRQLALPVRLSLAWAHAARLFDIILPAAETEEKLREILKQLSAAVSYWTRSLFDLEPEYWHDCLEPYKIERESFLGLATGALFANYSDQLLDKIDLLSLISEICFFKHEDKSFTHYLFWKDYDNRNDATGSFLGGRSYDLFNSLMSKRDLLLFSKDALLERISEIIQKIDHDEEFHLWIELAFMTDNLPINFRFRDEFKQLVEKTDFQKIWKNDEEAGVAALSYLAVQKEFFPEHLQNRIKGWLKWTVSQLSEKCSSKLLQGSDDWHEQLNLALKVAQIAAWMTNERLDPVESSRNWNEFIFDLAQIWTNLSKLLERTFIEMWLHLPTEQLQGIGKNLLLSKATK